MCPLFEGNDGFLIYLHAEFQEVEPWCFLTQPPLGSFPPLSSTQPPSSLHPKSAVYFSVLPLSNLPLPHEIDFFLKIFFKFDS